MKSIYLRHESKNGECRTPLTPEGAKLLQDHGVNVLVESSNTRVFDDQSYRNLGINVTTLKWYETPKDTLILGLKELPISDKKVEHDHIYFAHAFKGQDEAKQILTRFNNGRGNIYDLEFLTDNNNKRIAAFGYWAGFVGAGLGLLGFSHYNKESSPFPPVTPFIDKTSFINEIKSKLGDDVTKVNAMVMGYLGRCGSGAVDLLKSVGVENLTLWDKEEYDASSKPIRTILDQDIFINSVYLKGDIPPMIDPDLLQKNNRLRIISDVSCDPNSENNPIAVYNSITKMTAPFTQASGSETHPVYVQAIDHLPTLLPKESSIEFADDLLPHLLQLTTGDTPSDVWERALSLFKDVSKQYK
jgi:saccharopine dehydrogenase (NAD+, L-lysine-forming)